MPYFYRLVCGNFELVTEQICRADFAIYKDFHFSTFYNGKFCNAKYSWVASNKVSSYLQSIRISKLIDRLSYKSTLICTCKE